MKRQIIIPSFAVSPPLITTAPILPSVNQGLAYSQQLTAVGGYPPYNWTVVSDSGSGLTLNATSGVLSGNANVAGTFTIVIKVTDYRLFPSAPVSFSLTVNPTGSNLTIYHGLAIAVTLPGTGSKDHAGTLVFDQGFAPLTVVDPQWASAGGSLGFISGGAFTGADAQYNPGNVAYGMQTSGSTIAAPHIYSQACAKGTLAYNPPGSSAGEPTFTAQIGHSNKTFPKHTFISFKYRVDPLFVFGLGSPNNDNNWKFITYTDGATTCFTNAGGSNIAQYYYCGSGSGQGAFSGPAGVGWQCAFDEAFPAMNPTNLAIAPDNNGHSIEWPFGSADSGDPQYMTRYASQYNPVNPSNGFVITEYRIRWMTDTTGYVQARSSTIGLAFPPKLCINYQQQTAEPSGNGNTAVWNEGWICTYTRNYGTVGSPQYNNAIYVADHMYDQDGSNTYQAYLHDQPTLAASTWWEPQRYTSWINSVPQVVCNVATVPLGTAYITAVNDVGTESAAQKVTVVAQPAAPVITTASLPSATVGSAYSFDATSTGGVTPITWSATGLPAGLSITPSNGLITGTPTTEGTDSVTLAVQDGLNRWVYKTLTLTVNATGGLAADPFPRTRWQVIQPNSGAYAGATFQTNASKFNIVDCGPFMGIEQQGGASPFSTIFANIKAQSPLATPTRCGHYTNGWAQSFVGQGGNASTFTQWSATIQNANWWLRTSYPAGSTIASPIDSAATGVVAQTSDNTVTYQPTGATSPLTFFQGYAFHYDLALRQGKATTLGYASNVALAANPHLDFYQFDNEFARTRVAGSYTMDTNSEAVGNATANALTQQGQALQVAAMRAISPNILIMGNCDYFFHSTSYSQPLVTLDPSQVGLWDMVYCQACIGPGGIEESGSTAQMMGNLILAEQQMNTNGTLIFEQTGAGGSSNQGFSSASQTSWTATDWQGARFGLACACMRNYHFALNANENYSPNSPYFMDEYLSQGGNYGYLGTSSGADAPQTAARTQGVWWRKFPNGVVFMNPAGNGTQTINLTTLGLTGYSAIAHVGFGDATINTGAAVTSITLLARDGRFLIGV